MLYIKTEISDNVEIKVDLYEDEIYAQCPRCGKEIQVSTDVLKDILEDGNLSGTSLYCGECSKQKIEK